MVKIEIRYEDGFYVATSRRVTMKNKVLSKLLSKLAKYYKGQEL